MVWGTSSKSHLSSIGIDRKLYNCVPSAYQGCAYQNDLSQQLRIHVEHYRVQNKTLWDLTSPSEQEFSILTIQNSVLLEEPELLYSAVSNTHSNKVAQRDTWSIAANKVIQLRDPAEQGHLNDWCEKDTYWQCTNQQYGQLETAFCGRSLPFWQRKARGTSIWKNDMLVFSTAVLTYLGKKNYG